MGSLIPFGGGDQLVGFAKITRDITERYEAGMRLQPRFWLPYFDGGLALAFATTAYAKRTRGAASGEPRQGVRYLDSQSTH